MPSPSEAPRGHGRRDRGIAGVALAIIGVALTIAAPSGQALGLALSHQQLLIAFWFGIALLVVGVALLLGLVLGPGIRATWRRVRPPRRGEDAKPASGPAPDPILTPKDADNILWVVEQRDKLLRQTLDSVAVARHLLNDPPKYRYALRFGAVRGQHAPLPIGMGNYFYVDVHSEPNLPANSCTAQLLRVEKQNQAGEWTVEAAFRTPEDMEWDGEFGKTWPHRIEPEIPARLDLAYAWSTQTEPITYLPFSQRFGHLRSVTPGTYQLTVRVLAQGAEDLRGQFIVYAAESWTDLRVRAATQ